MRSVQLRRGTYVDSVTLMQVSRRVAALDGVTSALVAMATELNLDLAAGMGFEVPPASPNELLVAVEAVSVDAALAEVDLALLEASRPAPSGFGSAPAPVTVRSAAARSGATVALVSTPGQWAFADAVDALDAGLLTMVFSDNVPLEQEVALKEHAARAGLLVMGPDCGTAVVGGVGLGFANVVRPGPVGIVAASGTGAQHLMALLDGAGVGVSHCLGVGGRDLSAEVAGRSTLRALDLLDADEATELVVVVSKPPAPEVAEAVRARAASLGTPVLFGLLGAGRPDLTETAAAVVQAAGGRWAAPEHWAGQVPAGRPGGALRGLFVGGTLCDEAMLVASAALGRVSSNIPLDPAWAVGDDLASDGHTMLDFGDDRLTRGRPHPMIDGALRVERLRAETEDPTTGVLLLDVVLGLGSADDPAAELVPALHAARAAGVPVVVSVTGTRDDPQGLRGQVAALHGAGAWVHLSNAAAARCALDLLGDPA
ncbi:FdrA family protein [Nocardioides panacis]|uniref:FdrA family protein n=1 Tax=Nocardioides panacis TaxID=2849501 RepID=A0A975T3J8_9ACTN|nr:FdrA family protein [Nocardioides panacis]QWZ10239.1 FdrA family protein [Nocardioides panacis]